MMGMSWTEILLVVFAVIVLFGGSNRLPEMARSVGKAIGEFKRAMNPRDPSEPFENDIPDDQSAPKNNVEPDAVQDDEATDDA